MARLRSVEQGLPLIRAANTGISGAADAYGRVTAWLGLNEQGVVDTRLPRSLASPTLFSRAGAAPIVVFAVLSYLIIVCRRPAPKREIYL